MREACQDDLGEIDRLTLGEARRDGTSDDLALGGGSSRTGGGAGQGRWQDDGPTGGGWLGDGNKRRRRQQQQQQLSSRGASSSASALAGAAWAGRRAWAGSSTDPSEAMVGEAMVRYVCAEWKRA